MINAPRFPQGRVVTSIPKIVRRYDISPESKEKLAWAYRQVQGAMTIGDHEYVAIPVTNFDANPQTMQNWLTRACREMFVGDKHLRFRFRGSRAKGTLYIQLIDGKSPGKGYKKGMTLVSFQD